MTEPDPVVLRLASEAYQAGLKDDWEQVNCTIRKLDQLDAGVVTALIAWSDWYGDHAAAGQLRTEGHRFKISYKEVTSGNTSDALVPPAVKWAGWLITARVAMNEEAFHTVLDELPEDPQQVGQYVVAVLEALVLARLNFPRGFALKDKDA